MKKKFMAMVALGIALSMSAMTVYATEATASPTSASVSGVISAGEEATSDVSTPPTTLPTLSGDIMMLPYVYELVSVNNEITESLNGSIGLNTTSDETVSRFSDEAFYDASNKMHELQKQAWEKGLDMDGIAFDITFSDEKLNVDFIDSRLTKEDFDNNLVEVYLKGSDGTWNLANYVYHENGVTVGFTDGAAPVMIIKYTDKAQYSEKPEAMGTISGSVGTSPKTGDTTPYIAMTAIIALAGIIVSTRKLVKR